VTETTEKVGEIETELDTEKETEKGIEIETGMNVVTGYSKQGDRR
jgi:hypothetical protein